MTTHMPRVTLEQWRVLQAVVEAGSFSRAAEQLNRSQSSVSYSVARLQEQLPVKLLRLVGRKAELTEAGAVLLRRSRALVDEALAVEKLAASLAQGWDSELRLAVEIIFPTDVLFAAMQQFTDSCSGDGREVRLELIESVLSGTDEALFGGQVDLVVSGRVPPGFLGKPLMMVEFLAVAHHDHPLHRLGREVTVQDLKTSRQLVVRDSGLSRRQDAGWLGAEQRWTVSHLKTSIEAIRRGLGFAWLPVPHIREELDSGLLKPLPIRDGGSSRSHQLYLILADRDGAGPAVRELADVLERECRRRTSVQAAIAPT
ncbi:MAG: LysR family transcriptional regulator [Ectothiorhodospiraceae bacterium]|nr:LysR family transcriptional regulator [Ectothiorhodospiraceae bacterium]MCH8504619.1 LysR family transcriptional regulator [Ectothiorhodospiraceae bacterium]